MTPATIEPTPEEADATRFVRLDADGAYRVTRLVGRTPGATVGCMILATRRTRPNRGDLVAVPHPDAGEFEVEEYRGQRHGGLVVGVVF